MSKAFDTVNIHQLNHKIHNTHIPTTIIKFLANYLKGRRQYTSYNNHTSKHTNIKAGVPQGGVLSPTLFNIYQNLLPYLNEIHTWAHNNNLKINIHINNVPIPTTSNPTILGLTFDPKLKYSTYTDNTITKAKINTQSPKTPHINTLRKKQRNTHHHIQNITPFHHRIRQQHLVTHHLIHLLQQTPKNSKRSLENNHWLHPRHQHLHSETKILPLQNHLKLHASQLTQKASHPTHPLHPLTTQKAHPRYK